MNGQANSTSLAGTGIRNVKADAARTLTTSPATSYVSLSAYAFAKTIPASSATLVLTPGGDISISFTSPATDFVAANVSLPLGSTVTGMRVIYKDNSAQNVTVRIYYISQTVSGSNTVSTFTSAGSSSSLQTSVVAMSHVIDNNTRLYSISIGPEAGDTWDGVQLYVKGIVLEFTQ